MRNKNLVIFISTICLSIVIPIVIFGLRVPYTNAFELYNGPNVGEIIYKFDTEEIKNVYDLSLVTVVLNGQPSKVLTNRVDILKLLEDIGIVIDSSKRILSTSDKVQDGTIVRVITIGSVIEEIQLEVPFKTEKISTRDLPYGKKEIVQEGVLGIRTKHIRKTYEDGRLINEAVIYDQITQDPVREIFKIGVLRFTPEDLEVRYGYNCKHWYSVVDEGPYTDQEKQWLKFVMECESGCNAESDKNSSYKGLFQWNPRYWGIFFPNDNIYDGYAQIKNTIWKIRDGVKLYSYWPACHKRYVSKYGEFKR